MKLCALFTGGKDSTYSLHLAHISGHSIECLAAVRPLERDSMLYHSPGIDFLKVYERAYGIPSYIHQGSRNEEEDMEKMLEILKREFGIEGVSVGAIESDYQFIRFSKAARKLGLKIFAPLWHRDQERYMRLLPKQGIRYIISKISTFGLPISFLGRMIDEEATEEIIGLARKHGFNPAFEGGEAETMVLDAPLMKCRIEVRGNIVRISEFEGYYSINDIDCLKKMPLPLG